jgi:hypothetical protein
MSDRKSACSSLIVRHLDRPGVGERHTQIFGLAAGVTTEKMRVAVEAGGRGSPEFCGLFLVRVGPFTGGVIAPLAEEAFAAGDRERHNHPISLSQRLTFGSRFDHHAHGFMAQNVSALHLGNHPVEDVKVGTADRAGGDLDAGVARMFDPRVGHFDAADVALAVPDQRFHVSPSPRKIPAAQSQSPACVDVPR